MTDVLVERRDAVALVTLNRPGKRNALSSALMAQLTATVRELGADGAVRCAVLTGAPPAFCAGGDLAEMQAGDAAAFARYLEGYRWLAEAVRALPFPLIAAVNGATVAGGFELMCLADIRVAEPEAPITVGDVAIGLAPTSGLSWILPRLVGLGRAKWLCLANPLLDGRQSHAIGLVEEVSEPGGCLERALAMAASIAAAPGDGVRITRHGLDLAMDASYAATVQWEIESEKVAYAHPDVARALDTFLTRRR